MVNKTELKNGWHKLTTVRYIKDRVPLFSGRNLSSTEFAVLCLIAHQNGVATITTVRKHPYFQDISFSTIKRAVITLIEEALITASAGSFDRREKLLSIRDTHNG